MGSAAGSPGGTLGCGLLGWDGRRRSGAAVTGEPVLRMAAGGVGGVAADSYGAAKGNAVYAVLRNFRCILPGFLHCGGFRLARSRLPGMASGRPAGVLRQGPTRKGGERYWKEVERCVPMSVRR